MLNSRPSKKKDDGTKADQPAPPQRTPRAGEAEINLVRTLYANVSIVQPTRKVIKTAKSRTFTTE